MTKKLYSLQFRKLILNKITEKKLKLFRTKSLMSQKRNKNEMAT